MDRRPQSPSLVEMVLARMRKQEKSPWGRIQMLGHRWLTRLERNRLILSYHTLLSRRPSAIGLRSDPAIDIDSSFFLSLLFHLLILILLSWMTLSSRPQLKPGPIRVRYLDVARQVQRRPAKSVARPSAKPSPKPSKVTKKKPAVVVPKPAPPLPAPKVLAQAPKVPEKKPVVVAPKPAPVLPAPKVLAQAPKEEMASLTLESAEALIRLPTRQSGTLQTPQLKVKNIPDVTVDTALSFPTPQGLEKFPNEEMASLTRLPSRQSSDVQTVKIKVEPAPAAIAGTISEQDEIKLPEELLRGEGPAVTKGSPSVLSSLDYEAYFAIIERRVDSVWKYPEGYGTHLISLRFVLDRGGNLVRVEILNSANSRLDSSAIDAMKRASPFPPLPESLKDLAGEDLGMTFKINLGVKGAR